MKIWPVYHFTGYFQPEFLFYAFDVAAAEDFARGYKVGNGAYVGPSREIGS